MHWTPLPIIVTHGSGEVCVLFHPVRYLVGLVDWFSRRGVFLLVFFPPPSFTDQSCSHLAWEWNREHCWKVKCFNAVEKVLLTLWSRGVWVVPVKKLIYILLYEGLLKGFLQERPIVLFSPFWEGNLTFTMQDLLNTSTLHQAFESFPAKFMLFNPSVNCVAISGIHYALDLLEGKWLSRLHIFISKTPLPKWHASQ